MSTAIPQFSPTAGASRGWRIGLWSAQIVLAAIFGLAGVLKTSLAPAALPPMGIAWAVDVPVTFLRFIGTVELLGAIGLILPKLTPLAAAGCVLIQLLAIGFHAMRGETAVTLPMNIVLLALALFVVWGRLRKVPVQPR